VTEVFLLLKTPSGLLWDWNPGFQRNKSYKCPIYGLVRSTEKSTNIQNCLQNKVLTKTA